MLKRRVTRSMAKRVAWDQRQNGIMPATLSAPDFQAQTFCPTNSDILKACRDIYAGLEATNSITSQNLRDIYRQFKDFNRQLAVVTGKRLPLSHLLHERRGRSPVKERDEQGRDDHGADHGGAHAAQGAAGPGVHGEHGVRDDPGDRQAGSSRESV